MTGVHRKHVLITVLIAVAAVAVWRSAFYVPAYGGGKSPQAAGAAPSVPAPYVMAASPQAAGRYLVQVAGCNDCHTHGYMQTGGQVPEEDWLLGSAVGWRGPWGTTYASNLRLLASTMPPEAWVASIRARRDRPPMPWSNIHAMSDQDLLAIHAYLVKMRPAGSAMPAYVPPDQEPRTPYIDLMPRNLPQPPSGGR